MKAISLWQPWASAIALGVKRIETRSWSTSYRGQLAIHAARATTGILLAADNLSLWATALRVPPGMRVSEHMLSLPRGAIVATCELAEVVTTESLVNLSVGERALGDYSPGRFAWILEGICRLPEPIPFRGRQQLFEVPAP